MSELSRLAGIYLKEDKAAITSPTSSPKRTDGFLKENGLKPPECFSGTFGSKPHTFEEKYFTWKSCSKRDEELKFFFVNNIYYKVWQKLH